MSYWNPHADPDALKLRLAAEILRTRSPLHVRAFGTSMLPFIWPGDILEIEHCDAAEIGIGDVIRFMQAGRFVIHRVVAIHNDCGKISWITRGDALTHEDAPVASRLFVGRVCTIRRNNRSFTPPFRLSQTAHWFGRTLRTINFLHRRLLQIRRWWSKRHDGLPALAKS
jgi:signal peptidase I